MHYEIELIKKMLALHWHAIDYDSEKRTANYMNVPYLCWKKQCIAVEINLKTLYL